MMNHDRNRRAVETSRERAAAGSSSHGELPSRPRTVDGPGHAFS
jgi:hypothetical protein